MPREAVRHAAEAATQFVPLIAEAATSLSAGAAPTPMSSLRASVGGILTVEVEGALVQVRGSPGLALLTEVFAALRQSRDGQSVRREGRAC
jgi:transposase